ncbi:HD domain containing protein [Rhodotorula toruloides]|uniref:Guanosine-3',5'-bis(diphosphate) 3'-pyrophosphohydrolase MESH1 n=1 Tax=Rhodotorula toruloides TaxID=5286 RepID=A0A0K3CK04_RHOTO|nr:HD domain containing protein [Rhodotorula toruloides]PRQ72583.1 hypothetical protein AAT19DRAFT_16507 [Rhodotorula toruloides]
MSLTADLPLTPITTDPSLTFQLLSTAHFAAVAHSQQRRKSPSSPAYVQHPLHVAALLASPASSLHPNPPVEVLQAAMLHDVIEDTETTVQELRERFGDVVTNIVLECSDDKSLSKEARKQAQIDHSPHKSDEAKHVKLADKLSNLTDLMSAKGRPAGWSVQRIQEYFVWSKRVTDSCKHVNPGLGEKLDEIYRSGTFELGGKTYKCHPDCE